jgi:tRNA (guanine26-N2/guanine27-N2)-dimethyltransferase
MQEHYEGKAKLIVPVQKVVSKDLAVFFNQEMERNRSLSVAVLTVLAKKQIQICLPLAGSGVRAVRFLKELPVDCIKQLVINDMSSDAIEMIHKQLQINDVQDDRVEVTQQDASTCLELSSGFDYIDIDPFGSPNFLLDVACKKISRQGILAVTATDTGALAGSFVDAGHMKYWATNTNNSQKHEIGLRILARKVMLIAMQHDKALTPILSYHEKHYYRIFFRVEKGKKKAAATYPLTTYMAVHCPACGYIGEYERQCPHCSGKTEVTGPCYSGQLQDRTLLEEIMRRFPQQEKFLRARLEDDLINQVSFYDTHELAKLHGKQPIKIATLVARLEKQGIPAVQSCFEKTGIKTTASLQQVLEVFTEE